MIKLLIKLALVLNEILAEIEQYENLQPHDPPTCESDHYINSLLNIKEKITTLLEDE